MIPDSEDWDSHWAPLHGFTGLQSFLYKIKLFPLRPASSSDVPCYFSVVSSFFLLDLMLCCRSPVGVCDCVLNPWLNFSPTWCETGLTNPFKGCYQTDAGERRRCVSMFCLLTPEFNTFPHKLLLDAKSLAKNKQKMFIIIMRISSLLSPE